MLIHCTKGLLDQLKLKPTTVAEEKPPLFSWHANIISLNRRKAVVLVNDLTRYVVVLFGLKAKDFQKLHERLIQAITETWKEEGIKEEVITKYLDSAGEVTFQKTKDKGSVARLNRACIEVPYFEDWIVQDNLYQPSFSRMVSQRLVGNGTGGYLHPNEELYKELETFNEKPIFDCQAVMLKITLELENFEVFRRVIVPIHLTFSQLHRVIQIAFGWQDYHLHEFYIFGDEKWQSKLSGSPNHSAYTKEDLNPIMHLICDEESFKHNYKDGIPMKMEDRVKLSDYMPARMVYIYDPGDNWRHQIIVEDVITDYDKNYPECVEAAGMTPPEDVGGEGGFETFLEILANENHPEHLVMKEWGHAQGYEKIDMREINYDLKRRV